MTALRHPDLIGALAHWAGATGDRTAFTMAADGLAVDDGVTCRTLFDRSRVVADMLGHRTAVGDRVLLLYPPGLDFIAGFMGCLMAGCIAVPAYPPRRTQRAERVMTIAADCAASLALTVASMTDALADKVAGDGRMPPLPLVATDRLAAERPGDGRRTDPAAQPIALLQYTSGSTGDPKGVVITHENLIENAAAIETMMGFDDRSVLVSWLPNFHDMGLITSVVLPLYTGFTAHFMPPAAFVRRPMAWLQRISDAKASHAGCPNFGYDLCVEKVGEAEAATLDLSRWRVALNGAEPVQARTLQAFAAHFRSSGFDIAAFRPCFGMAESTLYVTGGGPIPQPTLLPVDTEALKANRLEQPASTARARLLVGCGTPPPGVTVRIADPATRADLGQHAIGEVWLAGPSVGDGYWGKPEVSTATFHARLAGDPDGQPFLRTGDLGFLREGQLFVTGRIKETLILRGQTTYPLDFEVVAADADPALAPGQAAAFALIREEVDHLAVAVEVRRETMRRIDPEAVCARIRGAIVAEFDVDPVAILLLPPLTLPKTSSGKIQRGGCRTLYETGELKLLGSWVREPGASDLPAGLPVAPADRSAGEIAAWITDWLAATKGVAKARIGLDTPFVELGLDSVAAVTLAQALTRYLGWSPPQPETLAWTCPTIGSLAGYLARGPQAEAPPEPPPPGPAVTAVDLPTDLAGLDEKELARLLARELEGMDR